MILAIRNSRLVKGGSVFMAFIFLVTLNPLSGNALTGGPAQPEFNSFTPIGTSDMVDLATGDFSYNIPLMDVGGFPLNLAYGSGVTTDQEATWVGLGWNLSVGQINRQMRGLPDDFKGEEVTYENNMKDNWTVGGTFQGSPELFGFNDLPANIGVSAEYNSYTGFSFSPSYGISYDMANGATVGVNLSSSPDGLVLSPKLSYSNRKTLKDKNNVDLTRSLGVSFNSRQGLTNMSFSVSEKSVLKGTEKRAAKSVQSSLLGSSISFVNNTYTPSVQTKMMTVGGTFNTALSLTALGLKGEAEVTGYARNQFAVNKTDVRHTYGYEHTEKASDEDVLDFNREKDGVFSVNSTNLPLTNYTYDIYSVQGQGVSGMFHPFRSQVGYVHDNKMVSNSSGLSGGGELGGGWISDVGLDIEATHTRNRSGIWRNNNEALSSGALEENGDEAPDYEEVYFKNVGDLSVDHQSDIYNYDGEVSDTRLGGYEPIRLKFDGLPYNRTLKSNILKKGETFTSYVFGDPFTDDLGEGWPIAENEIKRSERVKRNQTILKLSEKEMADLQDRDPHSGTNPELTGGFIITRNDGARYTYGKALYNTVKKEVTFAVGDEVGQSVFGEYGSIGNTASGLVGYSDGDNSLENKKGDHYFNGITTPAYGHTFLLTSLVSTDYSDRDEVPGPSVDDFGSYTLFTYRDMGEYQWRVPFQSYKANFNEGLKTDPTDDKASYVYGKKELSYIKKIETKTHVAVFHISPRRDAFGVGSENGGMPSDPSSTTSRMYKLDKVMLYSRGEFYADGVTTGEDANGNIIFTSSAVPIPIKTVHFEYDYSLCKDIPNNWAGTDEDNPVNQGGKLTLTKVYFTYRNSNMGKYSPYEFTYGNGDADLNKNYNLKGYDVWGCYKENVGEAASGAGIKPLSAISAPEFNYVDQTTQAEKDKADEYAAMWSLTDISLPSGGKIQVDYESDDYQYVQDKKAMRMFKLAGAGSVPDPSLGDPDFHFYADNDDISTQANNEALLYKGGTTASFLYFKLDEEDQAGITDAAFRQKYLQDIYTNQKGLLQFRMLLNMMPDGGKNAATKWKNAGFDYVSGYAELDAITHSQVFDFEGKKYGSIKLKTVDMEGGFISFDAQVSPIAKAGWQFARRYLGRYVYGMPALEDGTPAGAALEAVYETFENLYSGFSGGNKLLRDKKIARRFIKEKSWIRLGEPTTHKKGGGCRVKQVVMTDEWAGMNGVGEGEALKPVLDQYYGQEYSYELANGGSSGVATYEPVGSKENPWVQPVFVNTKRLLAPDDQNYMEKPFGESFFPNPTVTYSRVTVKNLERRDDNGTPDTADDRVVEKHATGSVVTEFYTSCDYPTITDQTYLRAEEDQNPLLSGIFNLNVVKHLTLSQGYVVHLNDMNGKMKSQRVYAQGQEGYISGVDYHYDLTSPEAISNPFENKGKLDNRVWTMDPDGLVKKRLIGVEQSVINDFKEMKSVSQTAGVDLQTNTLALGPLVMAVPSWFPKYSRHVTKLNMATTTKIIHTYGVLRETVAHDAGASVKTRNLVWDSQTGEVLVTETVNEYNDKYYSFNFPAHWYYKGMGQAYFNTGLALPIAATASPGTYSSPAGGDLNNYLSPGDEVLVADPEVVGNETVAWVTEIAADGSNFYLMKADGAAMITPGETIRVVRSGRRNLQSTSMGSVVLQADPFSIDNNLFTNNGDGTYTFNPSQLKVDDTPGLLASDVNYWEKKRIINAGAVEFHEDWALQCECDIDPVNETYNPYRYNMKGVWRAKESHLYLTGRQHDATNPNPRKEGFYKGFNSFYTLSGDSWGIDPLADVQWTSTSEVTQFSPYGFELENKDALNRYSAAQYGYNFSFPLAVGANSQYSEMGFDGFEDYHFNSCPQNEHFGFRDGLNSDVQVESTRSHTGKRSLKVSAGQKAQRLYRLNCE